MRSRGPVGVLALAVVLCWVQGVVLQRDVLRDADALDVRSGLLTGAGVGTTTALLLLAAMVVTVVRHRTWWLSVALAVGVGTQAALIAVAVGRARFGDQTTGSGGGFGRGLLAGLLEPGSWLLLVVLVLAVVAAVRGRSRPAPPAPRDR